MLYDHIRVGQIRPERIRWMRRIDLEFIAANADFPPEPGYVFEADRREFHNSRGKLRGNVARASNELHRRDTVLTSVLLGTFGALVGAGVAALVQLF